MNPVQNSSRTIAFPYPSNTTNYQSQGLSHFTHPSHLLHNINIGIDYRCNGCNTFGHGTTYRCTPCNFDLHEFCAKCPSLLTCCMHPQHQLILENIPKFVKTCDFCRDFIRGMYYTCPTCNFDLHPLCSQLPPNVQSPVHTNHTLTLHDQGRNVEAKLCIGCGHPCSSRWCYRCNTCDFNLHMECLYGGVHGGNMSTVSPNESLPASASTNYERRGHFTQMECLYGGVHGGNMSTVSPTVSLPASAFTNYERRGLSRGRKEDIGKMVFWFVLKFAASSLLNGLTGCDFSF